MEIPIDVIIFEVVPRIKDEKTLGALMLACLSGRLTSDERMQKCVRYWLSRNTTLLWAVCNARRGIDTSFDKTNVCYNRPCVLASNAQIRTVTLRSYAWERSSIVRFCSIRSRLTSVIQTTASTTSYLSTILTPPSWRLFLRLTMTEVHVRRNSTFL